MPTSASEGKEWIAQCLNQLGWTPETVLDVGVGEGTYSNLFRNTVGGYWRGVEVYEPYISRFDLNSKYDTIIVDDIRKLINGGFDLSADLVFCGDVLEHMSRDDAQKVVEALLTKNNLLFISIPIIHFPQGEVDGNPHEAHVDDNWTHDAVLDAFEVRAFYRGDVVGVYALSNHPGTVNDLAMVDCEDARRSTKIEALMIKALRTSNREDWIALAHMLYEDADWKMCLAAGVNGFSDDDHRGYLYASIAAWNMKQYELARIFGKKALNISPNDGLLLSNAKAMGL